MERRHVKHPMACEQQGTTRSFHKENFSSFGGQNSSSLAVHSGSGRQMCQETGRTGAWPDTRCRNRVKMDNTIFCSCCGLQKSLNGKNLQEIALHCSHCGRAVKHWSCHRHGCDVQIWAKVRRNYVCTKCTKSEMEVAGLSSNISMLALALSLELYYKYKRHLVPDEEGDTLIELWRKARISGTEFARTAAKEAAAISCRASGTADSIGFASERIENTARSMMAELARNQARARASASVHAVSPHAYLDSNFAQRRPSKAQPLFTSSHTEKVFASTGNSHIQQQPKLKESTGSRMNQKTLILTHRSRRRRGFTSTKQIRPFFCGCRCQ